MRKGEQVFSRKAVNIPQAKILRVLQMVGYLYKGARTMPEISLHFGVTERTIYRYITLIESLGFAIERDWDGKVFMVGNTCPLCGEKHKSREKQKQDVHHSFFTNPGFFN